MFLWEFSSWNSVLTELQSFANHAYLLTIICHLFSFDRPQDNVSG